MSQLLKQQSFIQRVLLGLILSAVSLVLPSGLIVTPIPFVPLEAYGCPIAYIIHYLPKLGYPEYWSFDWVGFIGNLIFWTVIAYIVLFLSSDLGLKKLVKENKKIVAVVAIIVVLVASFILYPQGSNVQDPTEGIGGGIYILHSDGTTEPLPVASIFKLFGQIQVVNGKTLQEGDRVLTKAWLNVITDVDSEVTEIHFTVEMHYYNDDTNEELFWIRWGTEDVYPSGGDRPIPNTSPTETWLTGSLTKDVQKTFNLKFYDRHVVVWDETTTPVLREGHLWLGQPTYVGNWRCEVTFTVTKFVWFYNGEYRDITPNPNTFHAVYNLVVTEEGDVTAGVDGTEVYTLLA